MRPVCDSQASLLAAYNIEYEAEDVARPLWAMSILLKLPNLPNAKAVLAAAKSVQDVWAAQPVVHVRARREDGQPEGLAYQSTEENFLRIAGAERPRFLLFDGHGIYNDKVPSFSGLVFNLNATISKASAETSSIVPGEGFLRVAELFDLDLTGTELAFLAACQTALGQVYRGEGINALTRAFMVQGSPAVVSSLWAVSDQITSILVRRFFALVAQRPGEDRARLLCQVRRTVSQSKECAAPYYWAPFVLSGASSSPIRG
jgi:CHAT domain-containing protein